MPGRQYTGATGYRYGFNGKEDDQETVGTGNGTQDYGMRIYNPSLGKFLSVDPLSYNYPELTPFQFASNRPIDGIDLDGLEYHQNARPGEVVNGFLTPAKDNTAIALTHQQVVAALSKKAPPPPASKQTFIGQGGTLASPEYKMAEYYHPIVVPGFGFAEAAGEYNRTGKIAYGSLVGVLLSILPGEMFGKLITKASTWALKGAGQMGKCIPFAKDFMKNVAPKLQKEGAIVTEKAVVTDAAHGIWQNGQSVTENGYHTLVEIVRDGKTYIVDNLNDGVEGVLKENYIKDLNIFYKGVNYYGEEAYKLFKSGNVRKK